MVAGICEFNIVLMSFCLQFWFVSLTSKYFKFVPFSKYLGTIYWILCSWAWPEMTMSMQVTHTHPAYVILIASPVQQWFDKLITMMYVYCLSCYLWKVCCCPRDIISSCWFVPFLLPPGVGLIFQMATIWFLSLRLCWRTESYLTGTMLQCATNEIPIDAACA